MNPHAAGGARDAHVRLAPEIALGIVFAAAFVGGCGRAVQHGESSTAQVGATAAPPVRRLTSGSTVAELAGSRAVVHGICPTECCQYGNWTIAATAVRDEPDDGAHVRGRFSDQATVRADSGVAIIDTVGVVAVARDTLGFAAGDTIVLLNEGEDSWLSIWRDQLVEVANDLTPAANGALRIERLPSDFRWWAYVTGASDSLRGWISTTAASPRGADGCGG